MSAVIVRSSVESARGAVDALGAFGGSVTCWGAAAGGRGIETFETAVSRGAGGGGRGRVGGTMLGGGVGVAVGRGGCIGKLMGGADRSGGCGMGCWGWSAIEMKNELRISYRLFHCDGSGWSSFQQLLSCRERQLRRRGASRRPRNTQRYFEVETKHRCPKMSLEEPKLSC